MNRHTTRAVGLILLLSAGAFAQHLNVMSPVRSMPPPVNALPFGNILFPGGMPSSHAGQLAGTISGSIPYVGTSPNLGGYGRPGFGGGGGRFRTTVVPYAVPVFVGGGYGGYYQDPYAAPQPNVTVVIPQQPTPSVVINQHYTPPETPKPVLRDYSRSDLPESGGLRVYEGSKSVPAPAPDAPVRALADDKPTIYLIALKDSTVRQAIGYWLEDETTLKYVTPKGTINRISIDQVDRETSVQLNAERKLEFDLTRKR